jgi:hypothetical protein
MFAFCILLFYNKTGSEQIIKQGVMMKNLLIKIKSSLETTPKNAFLLFLTGFLFTQVMLLNVLYTRNPDGGWVTAFGNIPTITVLFGFLFALALCLIVLWRTVTTINAVPA